MNVEPASGLVVVGPNWTLGRLLELAFPALRCLPAEMLEAIEILDAGTGNGRKMCLGN